MANWIANLGTHQRCECVMRVESLRFSGLNQHEFKRSYLIFEVNNMCVAVIVCFSFEFVSEFGMTICIIDALS